MTRIEKNRRSARKEWLATDARSAIKPKTYYKRKHYKPVALPHGVQNCKIVREENGREWTGLKTHRRKDKMTVVLAKCTFPSAIKQTPAISNFSAVSIEAKSDFTVAELTLIR